MSETPRKDDYNEDEQITSLQETPAAEEDEVVAHESKVSLAACALQN